MNDTLIVQARAYGEYLGQVKGTLDRRRKSLIAAETTARLIAVTEAGTPSAEAEQIVARWGAEADKVGSQVIGEAAISFPTSRGQETALGNLITDAMRAADLGDGRRADVAMHNDGGIRDSLDAGPITYAEMYAILPFDNILVGIDLTGAQVREMLENGMGNDGSQIQVSGLRFGYSLNKARGRRIVDATVNGERLDPDRIYRVVSIDYLYTNPKYKLSLGKGTNVTYGGLCLDAVIEYIRMHSPVHSKVESRITKM
jgi:5'-nucleotidase